MVAFDAYAGSTYHIMAFSDTAGVNGGTLQISVDVAPPPPTLDVKLSATGKVDPKTGITTISGTVDCTSSAGGAYVDIEISIRQPVGRIITVTGSGYAFVECGTSVPFSATIVPTSGIFKPGTITASMWAYVCDDFGCASDEAVVAMKIKK
jgi:hypothetical protein